MAACPNCNWHFEEPNTVSRDDAQYAVQELQARYDALLEDVRLSTIDAANELARANDAEAEVRRLQVLIDDAERSKNIGLDFWTGETRRREQAEAERDALLEEAAGIARKMRAHHYCEVCCNALANLSPALRAKVEKTISSETVN